MRLEINFNQSYPSQISATQFIRETSDLQKKNPEYCTVYRLHSFTQRTRSGVPNLSLTMHPFSISTDGHV